MIKGRIKKKFNQTGIEKEYYLDSLDEWLTIIELSKLNGCTISKQAVAGRIAGSRRTQHFNTLDECVFRPKVENSRSKEERERVNTHHKERLDAEFEDLLAVHRLFIVRPYKPRIIGSR